MCKLTPKEETILRNMKQKEKGLIASALGIDVKTVDTHLARIRRKRAECQEFTRKTDLYKKELYPRRKGE